MSGSLQEDMEKTSIVQVFMKTDLVTNPTSTEISQNLVVNHHGNHLNILLCFCLIRGTGQVHMEILSTNLKIPSHQNPNKAVTLVGIRSQARSLITLTRGGHQMANSHQALMTLEDHHWVVIVGGQHKDLVMT